MEACSPLNMLMLCTKNEIHISSHVMSFFIDFNFFLRARGGGGGKRKSQGMALNITPGALYDKHWMHTCDGMVTQVLFMRAGGSRMTVGLQSEFLRRPLKWVITRYTSLHTSWAHPVPAPASWRCCGQLSDAHTSTTTIQSLCIVLVVFHNTMCPFSASTFTASLNRAAWQASLPPAVTIKVTNPINSPSATAISTIQHKKMHTHCSGELF